MEFLYINEFTYRISQYDRQILTTFKWYEKTIELHVWKTVAKVKYKALNLYMLRTWDICSSDRFL